MEDFINMLGYKGIIITIGVVIFLFTYKYSIQIFDWIEHQTFGTREYILKKLELLFIEVNPDHITYILLFLSVGLGSITAAIFGIMGKWFLGFFLGGIFSIIGFKIPKPFINHLVHKRIKAYQEQMVDGLQLLSNGLRAGLSVPQAIGMVVDEMPPPISQEFGVILQQNRMGVTLEDCLDNLVERVPTEDNEMFVSSVNILRETGGNLAEVFDTIVSVVRERIRLQQKIDTYIAQGLFQGYTIAAMPFIIGLIYYVSDPPSMERLFTNPLGLVMLFVALLFDAVGTFVILKIVQIKV